MVEMQTNNNNFIRKNTCLLSRQGKEGGSCQNNNTKAVVVDYYLHSSFASLFFYSSHSPYLTPPTPNSQNDTLARTPPGTPRLTTFIKHRIRNDSLISHRHGLSHFLIPPCQQKTHRSLQTLKETNTRTIPCRSLRHFECPSSVGCRHLPFSLGSRPLSSLSPCSSSSVPTSISGHLSSPISPGSSCLTRHRKGAEGEFNGCVTGDSGDTLQITIL